MLASPGILIHKSHRHGSLGALEQSVKQQYLMFTSKKVSLRVAGQIRIASGEISREAVAHTIASYKVSLGWGLTRSNWSNGWVCEVVLVVNVHRQVQTDPCVCAYLYILRRTKLTYSQIGHCKYVAYFESHWALRCLLLRKPDPECRARQLISHPTRYTSNLNVNNSSFLQVATERHLSASVSYFF